MIKTDVFHILNVLNSNTNFINFNNMNKINSINSINNYDTLYLIPKFSNVIKIVDVDLISDSITIHKFCDDIHDL